MNGESRADLGKTAIFMVPIFATTIAICYDVGFFAGSDIRFFSFFSLSEHIVFSLQAIPFALPAAFTIIGIICITWVGYNRTIEEAKKVSDRAKEMSPDELKAYVAKLNRQVKIIDALNPFVKGALFVFMVWISFRGYYVGAFLCLVSEVVSWMVYPAKRLESKEMQYALFIFSVLATWITASLVGYQRAESILHSATPTERIWIEGQDLTANLVRGGERGVLFVSFDTKKLTFLRWDAIKKIESL